jgi:HD-like signal output (HDOD) protein
MGILQRLNEITELPTLPRVVLRVRELILSDEGDAASLARLIEHDPPLSARVLKVANSSFYIGTAGPIVSVERAVARIGFNEIGNLAMAASLIKLFARKSAIIDYPAFWRHCIGAAYLSSMLGESLPLTDDNAMDADYFLAGLFHDVGILVYDQFFHEEFQSICSHAARRKISYVNAECETAPDDLHPSVGGALLGLWKINPAVIEGVERHHPPIAQLPGEPSLVRAVALSEILLRAVTPDVFEGAINPARDDLIPPGDLKKEDLPGLLGKANTALELAGAFFA